MKALTRNEGELILESFDIPGIDWSTGKPLTDPDFMDHPYTLIVDYHEPITEEESSE